MSISHQNRIRISVVFILILIFLGALALYQHQKNSEDPFQADAIVDPAFPSLSYSIQTFLWWDGGNRGLHLDWVRLMSYNFVKQTFAWRDMEPSQGEWHFEQADAILDEIEKRDLKLIARIGQVPDWAIPQAIASGLEFHDAAPEDIEAWAQYCGTLAKRYQGRIYAYQIWNEPNLSREWGAQPPDAAGYTAILKPCSEAIRENDPAAVLISAGLAPTGNYDALAHRDDIYLDAMYQAGFQDYVDAVGAHATGYNPPTLGPDEAEKNTGQRWQSFRRIEDLRKIMIQYGDAEKQIAILEFGWTTDPVHPEFSWFAVDEETQAKYLVEAYAYAVEHWRPWVGLMSLIYMPQDVWTENDEEYWWAITTPDKGHRPAFYALANMEKVCDDFVIPEREPDSPEALGLVPTTLCP